MTVWQTVACLCSTMHVLHVIFSAHDFLGIRLSDCRYCIRESHEEDTSMLPPS